MRFFIILITLSTSILISGPAHADICLADDSFSFGSKAGGLDREYGIFCVSGEQSSVRIIDAVLIFPLVWNWNWWVRDTILNKLNNEMESQGFKKIANFDDNAIVFFSDSEQDIDNICRVKKIEAGNFDQGVVFDVSVECTDGSIESVTGIKNEKDLKDKFLDPNNFQLIDISKAVADVGYAKLSSSSYKYYYQLNSSL